jgi:hypothetical protein
LLTPLWPSGVENCHKELPLASRNDTVLDPLNHENEYKKFSVLPNTNPRWPEFESSVPFVFFIQTGLVENIRGLNLKKCYPEYTEPPSLILESTYTIGEGPELAIIDLVL